MQTSNPEYSRYIHRSRYARYRDDLGRRETWAETVQRLEDYWVNRHPDLEDDIKEATQAVYNLEVMPSMRSLMTAGPALDRDHMAGFNCSYLAIDHPKAFDEMMYVLMCGTGVGYSVERQYVAKLPEVAEDFHETDTTIVFADSKIGWASGYRELISLLYAGKVPELDFSKLRPAGARLKTFGGRSSGPDPMRILCAFTVDVFRKAAGRKLSSLECHDLCCKIAEVVVVGGVRRSALISLSNLSDDRMRKAKSGQWWEDNAQRALANNSACYTEKPEFDVFLDEWKALYESKSGERGLFSRVAAQKQAPERRDTDHEFGTNPCSEIVLRSNQVCNLSEVVIRPQDTLDDLKRKVRIAAILGTLQSTLTNFRYLRKIWQKNTEEERLLGVSLTGIMDHPELNGSDLDVSLSAALEQLKQVAIDTNKEFADKLGIQQSAAITCVKPSGTVSQLVDSASGIHPRYSEYYLRTVRADVKDPLAQFMQDQGFYHEQDVMSPSNLVFYFPMKSPDGVHTASTLPAMEQLRMWEQYQDHWCEHKPSMTCYYREDEFLEVGQWVWDNFDKISGISFLPYSDHVYKQAPYQPCTKEVYEEWCEKMPKDVNWALLAEYENTDMTTGSQELACVGSNCEI
jgi:ribonucleoside-diphosphate reductase alpha chain